MELPSALMESENLSFFFAAIVAKKGFSRRDPVGLKFCIIWGAAIAADLLANSRTA